MNTGQIIKELRIKEGWTQEELGKRVGVGKAAVNKWESGIVVNLKRSTIEKLCDVFNVSPQTLMGYDVPPERTSPADERDHNDEPEAIAAHRNPEALSLEGYSDIERAEIENFMQFVKSKRGMEPGGNK